MRMHRRFGISSVLFATLVASAVASGGEIPEVTHDGLHRVPNTKMAVVWMKPGASLDPYTKVRILDCFVAFKKNWQMGRDFQQQISARRMDEIKKDLAQAFQKVFIEELQKGGYQVVDASGHDVLLVRPAIIDLDIEAPDSAGSADMTMYSASAGQMTLVAELYDSVTSDLILRAIDPEADRGDGTIEWQNGGSNIQAADEILRRWADRLRNALDEAHGRRAD